MNYKLKTYQKRILDELRTAENPLKVLAAIPPGAGRSLIINALILEQRLIIKELIRLLENGSKHEIRQTLKKLKESESC